MPLNHNEKVFETGLKLIEVNGKNIHSVIKDLSPFVCMMRWDFERKRYYKETFYKAYNFSTEESIRLKFTDKNGNAKDSDFNLSEGLNYTNLPKGDIVKEKKVEHFPDEQILYASLPKMDFDFV